MNNIYLLVNLFLLLIPIALLFDRKVFSISQLKSALLPSFIVTVIFSEIGVFFAGLKIITFNQSTLLGFNYRLLPLEHYLYYFTLSFASINIYYYLNSKFPKNDLQKYSLALSNLLLGIFVAILFFEYSKWYPLVVFAVLFLLLLFVEYKNQLRFMYRFYRAYAVCLIIFLISFGIVGHSSIISYQPKEMLNINLLYIPIEDFFQFMAMLLLGVFITEFIQSRKTING